MVAIQFHGANRLISANGLTPAPPLPPFRRRPSQRLCALDDLSEGLLCAGTFLDINGRFGAVKVTPFHPMAVGDHVFLM